MANEERFTGLAKQYAQYRPSYPAACLDYLAQAARLKPGDAVADVGAGTGIFSALLLARGYAVSAVEPNADMRAEAAAVLGDKPGFTLLDGTAEHTGLSTSSVKLVTACQAFHWFDAALYAAECRRILAAGCLAAVLWNSRDRSTPLVQAYDDLRLRYQIDHKVHTPALGTASNEVDRLFPDGFETKLFPNPQAYTEDAFTGHALSASYAPRTGAAREEYVAGLRTFFADWGQNGLLQMPMVTEVYCGKP